MSDKLSEAIQHIKSGNKTLGKQLLTDVLKADSRNEIAWLWMSAVVDKDDLRRECLEEVLKLNPDNQPAYYEFKVQEPAQVPMEIPQAGPAADKSFKFRYVIGGRTSGLLNQSEMPRGRG